MLARRFYDLAESLAMSPQSGPAENRTAISRAYYAAFHHANEFLIAIDVQPPSGQGGHGGLRHVLSASADNSVVLAGSSLFSLYSLRRKADYFLTDPNPERPSNAVNAVHFCADVLIQLDNCLADPVRKAQVRTTLRTWAVSRVGQSLNFKVI